MIDSSKILLALAPQLKKHPYIFKFSTFLLRHLVQEHRFNEFFQTHTNAYNFELVEQALQYLNVSYSFKNSEIENIPASGKVVIIANHPLGCIDAFALIDCVAKVRRDVKIVANQLLLEFKYLNGLMLPVNNLSGNNSNDKINAISQHLQNDACVIIFPAGEVSRISSRGVREQKWRGGFLRLAQQHQAPIVPVFIDAKNSWRFYAAASLSNNLAMSLLPREIFKFSNKNINLHIGKQIAYHSYNHLELSAKQKIKLFNKHLYQIGKNKKGTLATTSGIAMPESKTRLKQELQTAQLLLAIGDNKFIYLVNYQADSVIIKEIGRLREIAFRAVGEGTQQRRDIDQYDADYLHIVVWDNQDLEIAGAYRLKTTENINSKNCAQIYSSSLFNYSSGFDQYFAKGVELGRSFVQPRYWGKRSLEYLWLGIGAFLQQNPQYRYLFGTVSLSQMLPDSAKDLIIYFYQKYYGGAQIATHKNGYQLSSAQQQDLQSLLSHDNAADNFKKLKAILNNLGASVPALYKQYSELCEPGGVQFIDFGIDFDFNNCIDSLVLVDLQKLKPRKRKKYLGAL